MGVRAAANGACATARTAVVCCRGWDGFGGEIENICLYERYDMFVGRVLYM